MPRRAQDHFLDSLLITTTNRTTTKVPTTVQSQMPSPDHASCRHRDGRLLLRGDDRPRTVARCCNMKLPSTKARCSPPPRCGGRRESLVAVKSCVQFILITRCRGGRADVAAPPDKGVVTSFPLPCPWLERCLARWRSRSRSRHRTRSKYESERIWHSSEHRR